MTLFSKHQLVRGLKKPGPTTPDKTTRMLQSMARQLEQRQKRARTDAELPKFKPMRVR